MTKDEWLQKVHNQLINLSLESREKVMKNYEDLFFIAKMNGKDEQEVIEMLCQLDNPADLNQSFQMPFIQRVLLGSSLVLVNTIFIIGPIVVIITIIVAFFK